MTIDTEAMRALALEDADERRVLPIRAEKPLEAVGKHAEVIGGELVGVGHALSRSPAPYPNAHPALTSTI